MEQNVEYFIKIFVPVAIGLFAIFYYFFSSGLNIIKNYNPGVATVDKPKVILLIVFYFFAVCLYYLTNLITRWNLGPTCTIFYTAAQLVWMIIVTRKLLNIVSNIELDEYKDDKKLSSRYYRGMLFYVIFSGFFNAATYNVYLNSLIKELFETQELLIEKVLFIIPNLLLFCILFIVVFFVGGMMYALRSLYVLEKYQIYIANDLKGKYPGLKSNGTFNGYIFKVDENYTWIKTGNAPLFCIKNDFIEGMKRIS